MFPILDYIDTLIAADFYEETNQPFLSEAMKLLNRPPLEFRFVFDSLSRSGKNTFLSCCETKNVRLSRSFSAVSAYCGLSISLSGTRVVKRHHSISRARHVPNF